MDAFRETLLKLLYPAARLLVALKIPPNLLSISGVFFGILSAYFFISQKFLLAILFFVLSGLADAVDGTVARLRGLVSPFGDFFDNFCSAYTDSAVFCGLITGNLCASGWGVAALVGILARLLTHRSPDVVVPPGKKHPFYHFLYALGGKGDRIIIIAIGAFSGYLPEAVVAVAILTNVVAIGRTIYAYCLEGGVV